MPYTNSTYEVDRYVWEEHVEGKRLVRPRPDVFFGMRALAWELDDGSVVGYTVEDLGGCPTCGPNVTSLYFIKRAS